LSFITACLWHQKLCSAENYYAKNEVWFIWLYGMSDSLVRAVIEVWNTKPLVAIIILLRMKSNKCFMGSYKAGLPERLYSSYNDVKFVGRQLVLQSS
jgi:hypothetical protein